MHVWRIHSAHIEEIPNQITELRISQYQLNNRAFDYAHE
jgi:hypothetical protein